MVTCCHFCKIASKIEVEAEHDRPILESNEYFAIPSIGGFVEGWSLVCPRDHMLSLRQHYSRESFHSFLRIVTERISKCYGRVVMFEHGSSCAGSPTSCGTDHAHLHVVPLRFSLVEQLMQCGRSWQQVRASYISQIAIHDEYLFYTDDVQSNDPIGLLHVLKEPTSQFFRYFVAKALQCEEEYDYRKFPFLPLAVRTRTALAGSAQDY